jgi:hypothetical protein
MIDSEGPGRVAKTDRVLRNLLSPTTSEVLRPLERLTNGEHLKMMARRSTNERPCHYVEIPISKLALARASTHIGGQT